jgi:hypothetical protein
VIPVPCQTGGFLGNAYTPFLIGGDPSKGSYRADTLSLLEGLTLNRVQRRGGLLASIDERAHVGAAENAVQLSAHYEKAFELLQSEKVRHALDVDREDDRVRDRYGRGLNGKKTGRGGNGAENGFARNLRGQNLLLARRLVEAGVPFVNVYDFKQQGQNWDAHTQNFKQHKDFLLPQCDRAFAALIEDLDERGLLDTTLVIALGEFGRTPKINENAGRDHWPDCYSALIAGGCVKRGLVYGTSDATGAHPLADPVTPGDLAATLFHAFGIDPATEIHDQTNRPYKVAEGRPIHGVLQ